MRMRPQLDHIRYGLAIGLQLNIVNIRLKIKFLTNYIYEFRIAGPAKLDSRQNIQPQVDVLLIPVKCLQYVSAR